jgi:hypothetical protein
MKYSIALSLLASSAIALPHENHPDEHDLHKRGAGMAFQGGVGKMGMPMGPMSFQGGYPSYGMGMPGMMPGLGYGHGYGSPFSQYGLKKRSAQPEPESPQSDSKQNLEKRDYHSHNIPTGPHPVYPGSSYPYQYTTGVPIVNPIGSMPGEPQVMNVPNSMMGGYGFPNPYTPSFGYGYGYGF